MEWRDEAFVIGLRKHGETSVIAELMTRAHGRHLGIVRGGRSKSMQPVLQPGNRVEAVWRARLEDQLGTYAVEAIEMRSALVLSSELALNGVNLLGALLRLLPERDPHPALYETIELIDSHLDDVRIAPALLVRFELALLAELGFGLDLVRCAVTGTVDDLVYVSPKTGRAVCRDVGAPYHGRLLALPEFLRAQSGRSQPDPAAIHAGFRLTGHFLARDIFSPRGLPVPAARALYIERLDREKLGA